MHTLRPLIDYLKLTLISIEIESLKANSITRLTQIWTLTLSIIFIWTTTQILEFVCSLIVAVLE